MVDWMAVRLVPRLDCLSVEKMVSLMAAWRATTTEKRRAERTVDLKVVAKERWKVEPWVEL